jgi:4-hydroxybenzoate polyprenyltransferase
MFVLATSRAAEDLLAVGAALVFAGAYTALAALHPFYRQSEKGRGRMERRALYLVCIGSLPAFAGAILDFGSGPGGIASLMLFVVTVYILYILGRPVIVRFRERDQDKERRRSQ